MKIVSNHGCTTDGLWIDDINAADLTESQLSEIITDLLQKDYYPDIATLISFIDDIARDCGIIAHDGYCDQCGDHYYTVVLDT